MEPSVSFEPSVSAEPSAGPSLSVAPSASPTVSPMPSVSVQPSSTPSESPTDAPSDLPSVSPTPAPTDSPSAQPSPSPSVSPAPSGSPSESPTDTPSAMPSSMPSSNPTLSSAPSSTPSAQPSPAPSGMPSSSPTGLFRTVAPPTFKDLAIRLFFDEAANIEGLPLLLIQDEFVDITADFFEEEIGLSSDQISNTDVQVTITLPEDDFETNSVLIKFGLTVQYDILRTSQITTEAILANPLFNPTGRSKYVRKLREEPEFLSLTDSSALLSQFSRDIVLREPATDSPTAAPTDED